MSGRQVPAPFAFSRMAMGWLAARNGQRVLVIGLNKREMWESDGRGGVVARDVPEPMPSHSEAALNWIMANEARP